MLVVPCVPSLHTFARLALATSVLVLLRDVGCPCPAASLVPFWRVPAGELKHVFKITRCEYLSACFVQS